MITGEHFFVVLACILLTQPVSSKYFKSSLTFVIDDTSSMTDDINQVKDGVVDIFDTVMESNSSDIEDFVLVTFNDPFITYRVTAKSRDEFMEALGVVEAHCTSTMCGGDCPEKSLTGIERALKESRPHSHLYVFTDASSKDFEKYKKVKELAQKMQSQIVFGLTGQCYGEGNDKVFYDLAEDTSGQVFNLEKGEVEMMLKYVEETIKNRKTVITHKNFPMGTHNLSYTVDSAMKEIMISVSGTNPKVIVTDPDGEAASTEDIMRTAKVAIVKVKEVKPGVYNAEISSESETTVVVSGSTTVHFEHGFSRVKPSSIDDTATRPIPNEESYLAIKLNTEEDIKLETLQIIDMSNEVVSEKSLKLIIEKDKFYLTDPFIPPDITFRIAIKGYETKTNTEITRISLTPIEPQPVEDASKTPDKAPKATTVGESKINVAYNVSFQLRCKVAALPKPTVVWEDNEGNVLPSTLSMVELPYDYVSVLEIERVYKNATYTCKADNGLGHDYKEIEVVTVRTSYFDVLEVPKGAVVEFEKEEKFVCNVDARPPATITWYQNGVEMIEDDKISISRNRSILTIKSMQIKYDGHFKCEARNEDERKSFEFNVSISGLSAPKINKSSTEIRIREGSTADISCRITAGKPKPSIIWIFKQKYSDHTEDRGVGEEVFHIDNANPKHSGTYGCEASNEVGSDYHSTMLIVEYPPSVEKSTYSKTALEGEQITLSCLVKGEPMPEVKWLINGAEINKSLHYSIHTSNSLSFKATVSDSGVYTCEAINTLGSASHTINVEVFGAPEIHKYSTEIHIREGSSVDIECRTTTGNPKPFITWNFKHRYSGHTEDRGVGEEVIHINNANPEHSGTYGCIASNIVGSDYHSTVLIVEYPPSVEKSTLFKTAKEGEHITLSCVVKGEPKPEVKWLVNGAEINKGLHYIIHTSNSLSFKAKISDSGIYTCEAMNKFGSASNTINVDVFGAPEINKSSTEIRIRKGSSADIACRTTAGNPKPSITWKFKHRYSDHTEDRGVGEEVIHIDNASPEHSGTYGCIASNIVGSDYHSTVLIVEYPPSVKKSTYLKTAKEGEHITLSCVVKGEPKPEVKWLVNGAEINKGLHYNIHTSNSLSFKATVSDSGVYTCEAINTLGSARNTINVEVFDPPSVEKSTLFKTAKEGEHITLSCVVKGEPKPEVKWLVNGAKINKGLHYIIHTSNSLSFKATVSDSGVYTCEAINKFGSASNTINVEVFGAPEINKSSTEVRIRKGSSADIECRTTAGNPKPSITWNFKHRYSGHTEDRGVGEEVIHINNANPEHSGTYGCIASNIVGSDYHSTVLIVEYPPSVEKSTLFKTAKEGEHITLSCVVKGEPKPEVKWLVNGAEINKGLHYSIHASNSLSFKATVSDSGVYTCEAMNMLGSASNTINVEVYGAPEINKSLAEIRIRKGSSADIACRITAGRPKPSITWYFKHSYSDHTEDRGVGEEVIHIDNANPEHSGTYGCEASNVVGSDYHYTVLIVEYPPSVEKSTYSKTAKEGERITLPCFVKGEPKPEVKWFVNGVEINKGLHYSIYTSNSLSFKATVTDSGFYTCEAINALGFASNTINVEVFVPPSIETPDDFIVNVNVGETLKLPCHASGYPQPEIKWIFQSFDPKKTAQKLKSTRRGLLRIKRIQRDKEGFYTCNASNAVGDYNIAYQVNIYAPPIIENIDTRKEFKSVLGDLVLRVPCRATGNPKPVITWHKGGFNVAAGEYYDIEEDGTLVIKNVDKVAEGVFSCNAENRLGFDYETYEVIVEAYPMSGSPTSSVNLDEGETAPLSCDVPHKKTDLLRWFKDGILIVNGELTLKNVQASDNGIYICRVSDFSRSRNGYINVKVSYKPRFEYDLDDDHIQLQEGVAAVMDCSAIGDPSPEISWWHDGHKIYHTQMVYVFDMTVADRGQYFCLVENSLGHITRKFEISSKECLINIERDLQGNQPLIVSSRLTLSSFPIIDGHIQIQTGEYVLMFCPSGFENIYRTEIVASCEKETEFNIEEKTYKFSDLKCNDALQPVIKDTGTACQRGNTEKIKVGYEIRGRFLEVYEICYDKDDKTPMYSKQTIENSLADTDVKKPKWFESELMPYDFDALYDCDLQVNTISSLLRRRFHRDDMCCFSKRQLVNPRDVYPGLSQTATYSYLNVVSQWSTCSSKNWESVEQRVRNLAKSADRELLVWTGTSQNLKMQREYRKANVEIKISDRRSHQQAVPKYLWKVVQDPAKRASLAIIQVNIPDFTLSEAYHSTLCRDICNRVPWMRNSTWRDVKFGYTYCCNILDFERAFGYTGIFSSGSGKVLYDFP